MPQDGIGGTGQRVVDGLGGTGQKLRDGIGGTGIVGTITEFGSIWVNNAHVHFDHSTVIEANGRTVSAEHFKIGQLVAVLSNPIDSGYQAQKIGIVHEVIGPITSIQFEERQMTILNQTIVFDEQTRVTTLDQGNTITSLSPTHFVQISGLRKKDGSIFASRVDQIETLPSVQLIGKLNKGLLNGMPVSIPLELSFDTDAERLLIRGRLLDNILHVDSIAKDAVLETLEQATDLLLEGFLFNQVFDGDIVVGGIEIVLPHDFDIDADFDAEQPVFVEAELGDDDAFYSEGFMFMPEDGQEFIDYFPEFDDLGDEEIDGLLQ